MTDPVTDPKARVAKAVEEAFVELNPASKKDINKSTLTTMVALVSAVAGGIQWMDTKSHNTATEAVNQAVAPVIQTVQTQRVDFEQLKADNAADHRAMREDTHTVLSEVQRSREDTRGVYRFMKYGHDEKALEKPAPLPKDSHDPPDASHP